MTTTDGWPIAANLGQLGNRTRDGGHIKDAAPEVWAGVLRGLRGLGIAAIDPTDQWVPLVELGDDRLEEFRAVVAEAGMSIPSISMTRCSVVDPEHGEANLATAHANLDIAPRVGATVVNVGFMSALTEQQRSALWFWLAPGHRDDSALRPLAVRRVRELAAHAADVGVRLSLEMYEDTFLGSAADAVAFVRDVDRAAVGLNPDLGNLIRLHREVEPMDAMLEQVLPHANFWHVKNYSRDFDPATGAWSTSPTPLRTGYIDYRRAIGRALELGFDGPLCCEHYGADSIGVVADNIDYLRGVLAYWADR